ncbi:glycosyltransferase family 4 protein [Shewanella gelidii]|uniref:glycosyltransferase family 4 protein n=1 Tax=Shewanella gelidii TaxID=1642821 RepID=UPI001E5EF085|nr:glycosyltransferase family 4 protein [Shewanella gelidii]
MLTQWFDPEPTFKGLLFAKALRDKGHQVEVVTGFPNYPGGNVYDGYKISIYQKDIVDGIVIHRCPLYPSHDSSALKRILNYITFALSSLFVGMVKARNIDVIYSYHPPLTTALSAMVLGFFKRVPFVVDIQDLWPDTLAATGMLSNKKVLTVVSKFCQLVYRQASKIVVLSPGFKSNLVQSGVPKSKVDVIYNWCDELALLNAEPSNGLLPNNGNLNVLFAGNLGLAQDLPCIVTAAELIQKRNVNVNIVFLGDGVAKSSAQTLAEQKKLLNVTFLPRMPMYKVGGVLSQADGLLVNLRDDELFRITIPSRTQANLCIGKPIIMGVAGDAADLIHKARAGFVCNPNDPISLADNIEQLASMSAQERFVMGERGKEYYDKHLSLNIGVEKFIRIFKEVS